MKSQHEISEALGFHPSLQSLGFLQQPQNPNPSFQRKLESSDFEAERHWIPAFAGMTNKRSGDLKPHAACTVSTATIASCNCINVNGLLSTRTLSGMFAIASA